MYLFVRDIYNTEHYINTDHVVRISFFKNSGSGNNAIVHFSGGSKELFLSQREGERIKVEIDGIMDRFQKRQSSN